MPGLAIGGRLQRVGRGSGATRGGAVPPAGRPPTTMTWGDGTVTTVGQFTDTGAPGMADDLGIGFAPSPGRPGGGGGAGAGRAGKAGMASLGLTTPNRGGGGGGGGAAAPPAQGFGAQPLPPSLPPIGLPNNPTPVEPPTFDNTAETDPGFNEVLDLLRNRFSGDAGAGQAIDLAGGKIREAGIGAGKELGANLAARGVSGTGAETLARTKLAGAIQGDIAGAAADIANQREREKDAELGMMAGVVGNRASSNLANRQHALNQWEAVRGDQRAQEAATSAQQMAILQFLASLGMDVGGDGGYGGYGAQPVG